MAARSALTPATVAASAIFEIMHMREGFKNLILKTFDATQIRQFALQYKMKTLRRAASRKCWPARPPSKKSCG
jgi:type II secretory ATPase GspE/PulE/Tfp pilus assembly ATPase PilB-like protein